MIQASQKKKEFYLFMKEKKWNEKSVLPDELERIMFISDSDKISYSMKTASALGIYTECGFSGK